MDWTPLIHAAVALTVQIVLALALSNWWLGAALACAWSLSREHAQAEYRRIEQCGNGHRAAMPWWGGFDLRAGTGPVFLIAPRRLWHVLWHI